MHDSPRQHRHLALVFAALPIISFAGQYILSTYAGTVQIMLRHTTVTYVDWIFVIYNWAAFYCIDWSRGLRLFVISIASVTLNAVAHAAWEYGHVDPGHMISSTGEVMPAGWLHLVFSTIETTLLLAFVFIRSNKSRLTCFTEYVAVAYFLFMAGSAYYIHRYLRLSDAITSLGGITLLLLYPRLFGESRNCSSAPSSRTHV